MWKNRPLSLIALLCAHRSSRRYSLPSTMSKWSNFLQLKMLSSDSPTRQVDLWTVKHLDMLVEHVNLIWPNLVCAQGREEKFRRRVKRYVGIWCCEENKTPGHIYYDMYWDEKPGWKPVPPQTPEEDHPPFWCREPQEEEAYTRFLGSQGDIVIFFFPLRPSTTVKLSLPFVSYSMYHVLTIGLDT